MKSAPVKYGTRFGCRFGQPHDFVTLAEKLTYKIEKCRICGQRKRWNMGYKGRINNVEYLKAHVRNYAQPNGSTKRVYMKLYQPEKCIITI
jgi:hypothetical protein